MGQEQSLAWQDIPASSKDEFESQRGAQSLEQKPGRIGGEERFEARPQEIIPWSVLHLKGC